MYGYRPNINPALQKYADDVDEKKKMCINCPASKTCQKLQNKSNCEGRCQVSIVLLLARMVEQKDKKGGKPIDGMLGAPPM